jgi:hypothetical protein
MLRGPVPNHPALCLHARTGPQVQLSLLGITDATGADVSITRLSDEEFLAQVEPFNLPPAQQQLLLVLRRYQPRSANACTRLLELTHEEAQQVVHAQMAAFVAIAADVSALLPRPCPASIADAKLGHTQRGCCHVISACRRTPLPPWRCDHGALLHPLPPQVIANQPVFQRDLRQSMLSAGLQCKMEQCMSMMCAPSPAARCVCIVAAALPLASAALACTAWLTRHPHPAAPSWVSP